MIPSNYGYVKFELPAETCANCGNRCVAFHLVAGTSFCNLHHLRTQSSKFHTCADWIKDTREKPYWTQNLGMAFKMRKMEESGYITTFTFEGCCPSCKNCSKAGDMYYCKKYFDELSGQDRTCKMCEVDMFGRCQFYEKSNSESEKNIPLKTSFV